MSRRRGTRCHLSTSRAPRTLLPCVRSYRKTLLRSCAFASFHADGLVRRRCSMASRWRTACLPDNVGGGARKEGGHVRPHGETTQTDWKNSMHRRASGSGAWLLSVWASHGESERR